MNKLKVFAVLSTAFVSASIFGSCGNNNEPKYIDGPVITVVTTENKNVKTTTTAPATTTASTKKQKDKKTVTTEAETTETVTAKNKKNNKSNKKTTSAETENVTSTTESVFQSDDGTYVEYHFRNAKLLNQHFEKHGAEFDDDFGYETAKEYEKGASDVINNSEALHKTEAEDGDGVYYIEDTNEFVILSTDGYIRTYFRPNGGIDYYNRQ
ncbi:hypothetical protein SAMN02910265_02078 [Ruminococcus flavefaciens]|uniref:Colicin import membrane protein n=1 Tax=Ruminococcus flavefaciens TaxID=1265 RepID=A0A1H6K874_RUMFL|nr:hypothetical protein [Ruminococcus flavefaciens]SEH67993.1 hypothetical protein SAMN02910265_02078 [Ruminococcus flavefaciens]